MHTVPFASKGDAERRGTPASPAYAPPSFRKGLVGATPPLRAPFIHTKGADNKPLSYHGRGASEASGVCTLTTKVAA